MRPLTIAAGTILILAPVPAIADTLLQLQQVASGLSSPTFVTGAPGDTTHLYITEHGSGGSASIKVLNLTNGSINTFMTLTGVAGDDEQGILGLAFDPNYTSNGMFYVNYIGNFGTAGTTLVRQFHANSATSASSTVLSTLLSIDQPQTNHNGGWIGFSTRPGDERNLYIATGDGGNGYDQGIGHIEPGGNAQNITTALGKMLRIQIAPNTFATSTPANNPFAASTNTISQMIYTLGLRNPYRDSFDRATGNLYIGDVGQDSREEVDVQKASNPGGGENYGWRLREGNIQTPNVGGAPPPGYVAPIIDYPRATGSGPLAGRTVIGGYVYNGTAIPDLVGTYIFGDYLGPNGGRTSIFSLIYDGANVSNVLNRTDALNPVSNSPLLNISSFGEDTNGELYVVDITLGKIFKIVPLPPAVATWNGSTGSWSDASRWSTNPTVPNNSTALHYDAIISAGVITLNISPTLQSLTLNGGMLIHGGSTIAAKVDSLKITVNSGAYLAKYDLNTGKLIVQGFNPTDKAAKIAGLNTAINAGKTSGGAQWTGNGITSSAAAAEATHYAVGLFDNGINASGQPGSLKSNFGNQTVNTNSILITVAHLGDANLDGTVNIGDFMPIANNFNLNVNSWNKGDLNGDGFANIGDFIMVANNFDQTSIYGLGAGTGEFADSAASSVPEPASLAISAFGASLLLLRHKRKSCSQSH